MRNGSLTLPSSPTEFEEALQKLITKFENDRGYYLSKDYSEAQARVDFIDPFFRALGWDVENKVGLPHHEREVLVEKGDIDTDGRPDYNFRINGRTRFFVEAKTPSEHLDETRHIIQAKRYAWNTKSVFFVILTDFEELRFYDASIKPDERKPDEGLLTKLNYTEYLKSARKLWEFSRDRVAAGSLDAMLPRDRRAKRLRIPVDQAFLDEMTGWRAALARNVYKNNRSLTAKQLNEVVQRLLDRIVFVRIAEDRNIIRRYQLRDAKEEWQARGGKFHIFEWLNDLFHRVNEDFNGEIFKPHLSEQIKIDSEVLAGIIDRLYPPKSPYRFDVIGVELLGSIYERYLGSTIRPKAKRVFVEEKPEVRKAGGVYYTPQYIVDYIVKNTVGKVIEGKTPKQIEKIRILDPACGSGSFLIGAFQYLIDYHVRYLVEHPKEAQVHPLFPDLMKGDNGEPRLSVVRKARILRNNLFGVDIDPQAVEITMMSLYLKALEGERSQLPPKHHLLPELKYNIICGNSLIGPDIYKDEQLGFFGDEERERINAFDWDSESSGFGRIMYRGGFECVIGNPPYVRQETLSDWKDYFRQHYAAFDGVADLYAYFMEKDIKALKAGGRAGIIVSSSFMHTEFARPLRSFIRDSVAVVRIVDFGGLAVFENAKDTYVCIPIYAKQKQPARVEVCKVESFDFSDLDQYVSKNMFSIPNTRLAPEGWSLRTDAEAGLFKKLHEHAVPLGTYVKGKMFYGLKTGLNEAFQLSAHEARAIISGSAKSKSLIKPVLGGQNIRRYHIKFDQTFLVVIPSGWTRQQINDGTPRGTSVSQRDAWLWFQKNYGPLARHVHGYESPLRKRADQGEFWWELRPCDYYEYFESPKIVFPDICKGPRFFLDLNDYFLKNTAYCLGTGDRYLLGLLNSRLFWFAISNISIPFGVRAGEYRYRLIYQYMEKVPIRMVNFDDPLDRARHEKMVELVERMLELNQEKHSGTPAPSEIGHLEREIAATDAEIDDLVYELYGITDKERKIIDGD